MASTVVQICEKEVSPVIEKLGYDVYEIEYVKKADGMNLTFYIDKKDGILMEDCEKVSRAINDLLEELNPTKDETYVLNVSSLGLDRPIKNHKDFLRNKDKEVEVKLYSKLDGKKLFKGLLCEYTDDFIILDINGEKITLEQSKIAGIVPVVKF